MGMCPQCGGNNCYPVDDFEEDYECYDCGEIFEIDPPEWGLPDNDLTIAQLDELRVANDKRLDELYGSDLAI